MCNFQSKNQYYDHYVYFNFAEEDELEALFETNKNPFRIIELLSLIENEYHVDATSSLFGTLLSMPKVILLE